MHSHDSTVSFEVHNLGPYAPIMDMVGVGLISIMAQLAMCFDGLARTG